MSDGLAGEDAVALLCDLYWHWRNHKSCVTPSPFCFLPGAVTAPPLGRTSITFECQVMYASVRCVLIIICQAKQSAGPGIGNNYRKLTRAMCLR